MVRSGKDMLPKRPVKADPPPSARGFEARVPVRP